MDPDITNPYTAVSTERLSFRIVKAYATMTKGFIGNVCLPLFDRSSRCFSPKEGESMNKGTDGISVNRVEATKTSSNERQTTIN